MIAFGKLRIGFKLALLLLISLVGMSTILVMFLNSITSSLYQEKKMQSKRLVDAGIGVAKYFHSLESSGELNAAYARKLAMNALQSATYGEDGYFWITDTKGVMLMHPYKPDLIGKSILDAKDANGHFYIRDIVKTAIQGGGLVEYDWAKPDDKDEYRKISYVARYAPWDWVLGTGLYLDDLEQEIRAEGLRAVGYISIIFMALILVTILLSNRFMKQLKEIATRDPLTSLCTRRYLYDAIPILISGHDRNPMTYLSVLFFDIDFFKKVNDKHGHACGDRVLAGIGDTINKAIRVGDLGIRYGGEEFLVVMPCYSRAEAIRVAERIRGLSNNLAFKCGAETFSVTLSAGIAFRSRGEDFKSLLQRADDKLYQAKHSGRNRLVS